MKVLDDIFNRESIVLNSKLSIFLVSFLFTPLAGGVLYCINLSKVGKKDKIVGTYITVVLSNFFATMPFYGFEFNINFIYPLLLINHLLIPLIIVMPFWSKDFNEVNYKENFSFKLFILLTLIFAIYIGFNYWQQSRFSFFNVLPYSLFVLTSYTPLMILITFLPFRLLYVFFKKNKN